MSIHLNDHPKPITSTRLRRRNSDLAIASTLLAVAVMLGVGITAFSSLSLSGTRPRRPRPQDKGPGSNLSAEVAWTKGSPFSPRASRYGAVVLHMRLFHIYEAVPHVCF